MNSTPNYGFKEEVKICAIDAIDRELKRIENLIRCYNNSTCNCAGKVDKAEFEQHLADIEAHRELFESKVDKRDGYSLISQECLKQICQNKEGLHLLEQYFQKLQERSDWLEAELANKANKIVPQKYSLPVMGNVTGHVNYRKTEYGLVVLDIFLAASEEGGIPNNTVFGELPHGFCPPNEIRTALAMYRSKNATYGGGFLKIYTSGKMAIDTYEADVNARNWWGTVGYFSEQ